TVSGSSGLPTPWADQDIGAVGVAGSASYASGTFSVAGSGVDIWNTADGFHYAYQPFSGDGQIVARVASLQNSDAWAKAGVMIRETLGAGSTHALLAITVGYGSAFQRRLTTGGASLHIFGAVITAPYWVKLVRTGNTFSGYESADGANWVLVGTDTITMAAGVYAGLAVTAHNNTVLCTATLDNVSLTGTAPNAPPSVSITAPSNGASFTAP